MRIASPGKSRYPRCLRCFTGRGRVANHLATIFLEWLASSFGLDFQGNYGRGEAERILFCNIYRPADDLVFPLPAAPGEDPRRPAAINFAVTKSFNTTNAEVRRVFRNSASSAEEITVVGEVKKAKDYGRKVRTTWSYAFPGTLCPGSGPEASLLPGSLNDITGFRIRRAVFDTFGGFSEGTAKLLMS